MVIVAIPLPELRVVSWTLSFCRYGKLSFSQRKHIRLFKKYIYIPFTEISVLWTVFPDWVLKKIVHFILYYIEKFIFHNFDLNWANQFGWDGEIILWVIRCERWCLWAGIIPGRRRAVGTAKNRRRPDIRFWASNKHCVCDSGKMMIPGHFPAHFPSPLLVLSIRSWKNSLTENRTLVNDSNITPPTNYSTVGLF